jgi:subtilisin-like proprotein convertase family protein
MKMPLKTGNVIDMKKVLLLLILSTLSIKAQQATVLDPKSMTVPRYADLAAIQSAIAVPQTGMMVYNIATQTNWTYNGTEWVNTAGAGASQWVTTGANIHFAAPNLSNLFYSNTNLFVVPDNDPNGIISTISVPNSGVISNVRKLSIYVNLTHTWGGDLKVVLIAPDGTEVKLINRLGVTASGDAGSGIDFISSNIIGFNSSAVNQISPFYSYAIGGSYLPSNGSFYTPDDLNVLFQKSILGDWKLKVSDEYASVSGSLNGWSIGIDANGVSNGGYVGIGTTTPSAELTVVGRAKFIDGNQAYGSVFTSDAYGVGTWQPLPFQWSSNGVNLYYLNGKIGIGTNSPNAPLQFDNSSGNRKIVLYDGYNNDHQFFGFGISNNNLRYQTSETSADHVFYAGTNNNTSNELFRIKGNGNVGIGVPSPDFPLVTRGRIRIRDMGAGQSAGIWLNNNGNTSLNTFIGIDPSNNFGIFSSTLNSNILVAKMANGNIGINTQNPNSKLEVNGTMATKLVKVTTNSTHIIDETATVWYVTSNPTIELPNPSNCEDRRYVIVNASSSYIFFSGISHNRYKRFDGIFDTQIPNNSGIEIISDGTDWLQIK